jgi:hypothetical protein
MDTDLRVRTRLLRAVPPVVLFEAAMLTDVDDLVLLAALGIAVLAGFVARLWWLVPLIPTVFIIMLNVHIGIFGEIVDLRQEHDVEDELGSLAFAIAIWIYSLIAAIAGTALGKFYLWIRPYGRHGNAALRHGPRDGTPV